MELENFEKAKEINEQLDGLLRLNSFCNNSSTKISFGKLDSSNQWESIRLPEDIKDEVLNFIKGSIGAKIIVLEQQFKEL